MIYVSPQIHRFLASDEDLAAEAQADLETFILDGTWWWL